jgi:hypothetical protein
MPVAWRALSGLKKTNCQTVSAHAVVVPCTDAGVPAPLHQSAPLLAFGVAGRVDVRLAVTGAGQAGRHGKSETRVTKQDQPQIGQDAPIDVLRDGTRITLTVKPDPRKS